MQSETLIIGGGLAGAALAIALAQAGREVMLLEKEPETHHKVCGEFLSREAVHYLYALGLDLDALGAVVVDRLRLVRGDDMTEVALPFAARSLSRKALDAALLSRAEECGAIVRRGWPVQTLSREGAGWRVSAATQTMSARTVFLATGKHELRQWKRPKGSQNDLIAFKQYWRLSDRQTKDLNRTVELIMFKGGYAGLELVEDGIANLCLLVRRRQFEEEGASWPLLLSSLCAQAPHLAARLKDAEPLWQKPLALSAIPYGYVRRDAEDGLWRLGDQAAVIPSFAGDGMSIALHSARLAAACFLGGTGSNEYQQRMYNQTRGPVRFATLLSQIMVRPLGQHILASASRLSSRLVQASVIGTRLKWQHVDRNLNFSQSVCTS
jgi:flavin-dependent dehydrogenase